METASHRYNGAGVHKDPNTTASYIIGPHGIDCNRPQLQFEAQDELAGSTPKTAEECTVTVPAGTNTEQEETPVGPPVEGNDGLQSSSLDKDGFGNIEPRLHVP